MRYWPRSVALLLISLSSLATTQAKTGMRRYWIEFADKGITSASFVPGNTVFDAAQHSLTKRALDRRAAALGTSDVTRLVTTDDAPICAGYLSALQAIGVSVSSQAKWENSVSAELTDRQFEKLKSFTFVRAMHPVLEADVASVQVPTVSVFEHQPVISTALTTTDCTYDSIIYHYGWSDWVLRSINVLPLHAMGFDGAGVNYGILDCGFNWREMRTTKHHRVHGEYDFIFHDSITANQADDIESQDGHGSLVLSAATGYLVDSIIGPAYNPDLWLAKTEDLRSETTREEDNYASALEWMESQGIEITSASLGYRNLDSGFTSYNFSDLDGKTAISSRAAERAARLGVLVCVAAGNARQTEVPSLMAPSDADGILACGALMYNDTIADFSSNGPSADGRIKPDICAPGVYIPTWLRTDSLGFDSGTSLSTPLVSGACVLIKQAHPEATAMQIRDAVLETARHTVDSLPNNVYGYGKIDAYNAALKLGTIIGKVKLSHIDSTYSICVPIAANNGITSAQVFWSTGDGSGYHGMTMQLAADSLIYSGSFPTFDRGTVVRFYVAATDGSDTLTRSPRLASDTYTFTVGDSLALHLGIPSVGIASSVSIYPNPATDHVMIGSACAEALQCQLSDALGRIVTTFAIAVGEHTTRLSLGVLPNGTYRLLARSNSGTIFTRMIVIAR